MCERHNRSWKAVCASVALGVALSLSVAASAETIKRKFQTTANPSFLLRNYVGNVAVRGWDQNEIEIEGESASDALDVVIMGAEHKVSVQAQPRREGLTAEEARLDLQVHVPRNATVRVDSERGEIVVENLDGSVTIAGISTPVTLSGVKGNITVNTVDAPIQMTSSQGHIKADSISGNLIFAQVSGPEMRASTNSGTIRYEGDFGMGGNYVFTNHSAAIDILPSSGASFDLTARAVQGTVQSGISFRPIPMGNAFRREAPDKFLQGRFNTGESTVEVTSFSGAIRVQAPRPAQ